MRKVFFITTILLQVLFLDLSAQSKKSSETFNFISQPTEKRVNQITSAKHYRYVFMVNGGGPNIFGSISMGAMISDFANLEAGLALGKFHMGASVFINNWMKNPDFTPYVGAHWSYYEEFMGPTTHPLYFPAGIRYLNERGLSVSAEIAYLVSDERFLIQSPIWGGIKLGKYF